MRKMLTITVMLMLMVGLAFSQITYQLFDSDNSSLPYNQLYCIARDMNGNYWFGGLQSAATGLINVSRLAPDLTTWTVYNLDDLKLSGEAARYIAVDKKNNVWFCSRAGTTVMKADGTVEQIAFTMEKSCRAMQIDSKDNIYISIRASARANSLTYISSDYGATWPIEWSVPDMGYTTLTNSNGRPEIYDLREDSQNQLWVLTWYGLTYRKTDNSWHCFDELQGLYTYCMTIDKEDQVWVAIQDNSPAHPYDRSIVKIMPDNSLTVYNATQIPPLANLVQDIEADRNGHIWFTTTGGGLVELLPDDNFNQYTVASTNGGIPEDNLYDMEIFGDEIWIALDTKGVLRITGAITSVENKSATQIVDGFKLSDNYPNPFNPTTNIAFELPKPADITLSVYDMAGKLVKTVVRGVYAAGSHTVSWDGKDIHGNSVASGVYVYALTGDGFAQVKKMTLVK